MKVKRTTGPAAHVEAARHALDMLERGDVAAWSAVYDVSGIGRVSVTTVDGAEADLPDFDTTDLDPPSSEPTTIPGKGQGQNKATAQPQEK